MLINYTAWYWLDVFVADQCRKILAGNFPSGGNWLAGLVSDVETLYTSTSTEQLVLRATDYDIDLPDTSHVLDRSRIRISKDKDRKNARVVSTVISILEKWLKYPADRSEKQKAWFVHILVADFGSNILYLDGIWNIYSNIRNRLFVDGSWHVEPFGAVELLQKFTLNHPLHNPASFERTAVDRIAYLVDDLYNDHNVLVIDRPTSTERALLFKDTISLSLRQIADEEMQLFSLFVQANIDYQFDNTSGLLTHPRLQAHLKSNTDKFLIFRELAPSRARARSSEGPFTPELIRTTIGIYSAIVWRGITFGTAFAADGPMVFTSGHNFDAICSATGKTEEYFCDKGAYGVPNPFRTAALGQDYWKSLQGNIWEDFIAGRIISFIECWRFFLSGRNPPLFPQLGLLASYLLTADLYYAGVVAKPAVDDMVTIIQEMNKGAVAALERLRLIAPRVQMKKSKRKVNREECRKAFEFMAEYVGNIIPQHLHDVLCVDLVMVEHTLCKFSRASAKNLLCQRGGDV